MVSMGKLLLSVVILTKNEEQNIETCLKSVEFADQIVVVDSNSTDETVTIAKKAGAEVFLRDLENHFSQQRNFGMEKAKYEWILYIDADEIVSDELQKEITQMVHINPAFDAFYIKRKDIFWGKEIKYGEVSNVYKKGLIRLVRKSKGYWQGSVHEQLYIPGIVGNLDSFIIHYPHPTIKIFLQEINMYSTIRAKELYANGKSPSIFQILFFPLGKFISNYVFKKGFLDGPEGFIYSFLMSFHSFLVRSKLYQYKKIDGK